MTEQIEIKRALVSVYDKTGLDELVRGLAAVGVELVSTGGSASLIESLGLPVTKVEDLTGFPECLDGRVKTLHPRVHAGILADRRLPEHVAQLEELGVAPFDLVVVNLYPFTDTVMSGASVQECIEKIDIGGPSMVRAAAKNHASVAIVTDGADYATGSRGRTERRLHAGRARGARGEGVRPHGDLRRARGVLDGQRAHRHLRGLGLPVAGSARPGTRARCCATARTRTSRPRSTAPASARADWPRPSSCTARRCPTTTTSTPTPPGARRTTTATSRPSRSSSTPTRAGSPSAPMSPRRTGARTSATRCPRSAE